MNARRMMFISIVYSLAEPWLSRDHPWKGGYDTNVRYTRHVINGMVTVSSEILDRDLPRSGGPFLDPSPWVQMEHYYNKYCLLWRA